MMALKHSDAFLVEELEKKATYPMRLDYGNNVIVKIHEGVVYLKDVLALLDAREKELLSRCVVLRGKPEMATTITIGEILGEE
jgi:hypothetical protein